MILTAEHWQEDERTQTGRQPSLYEDVNFDDQMKVMSNAIHVNYQNLLFALTLSDIFLFGTRLFLCTCKLVCLRMCKNYLHIYYFKCFTNLIAEMFITND